MQFNNAAHNENQVDRFLGRNEFHHDGARLADAMMWANRDGGGSLLWAFDGQSPAAYGRAAANAAPWVEQGGITFSNYAATTNGGPYVTLDGAGEYLSIADAPWMEPSSNPFAIWGWINPDDTASANARYMFSHHGAAAARSWTLLISNTAPDVYQFALSIDGTALFAVTSSFTLVSDWTFVAGYFSPSTIASIYVGLATDTSLTVNSETTSVPASVFDANTPLTIGARGDAARLFGGKIGTGLGRINVPSASITSHMTRLFASTRWFYNG